MTRLGLKRIIVDESPKTRHRESRISPLSSPTHRPSAHLDGNLIALVSFPVLEIRQMTRAGHFQEHFICPEWRAKIKGSHSSVKRAPATVHFTMPPDNNSDSCLLHNRPLLSASQLSDRFNRPLPTYLYAEVCCPEPWPARCR